MNSYRKTAVIVGVLFIIATTFFVLGQSIYSPFLGPADYMQQAIPERSTILAGMLIELIAVLSIALIPVFMFTVLKPYDETLASRMASAVPRFSP